MKLSKTQQELFDAMRSGVEVHHMPYMGWFNPRAYFYRSDNHDRVTAAANALIEKRLARVVDRRPGSGRLALVEQEAV